ncbi:DUF1444 family protein [Gemella sp. GH3]|uniref:DUF1444 family protein n=1 Tax=unclassified Gemella TaxID=2624949 RepID=UPI0015D04B36|nr:MULTISPECIES: DUF1444 family protein [unclassified Gemella]MBF0713971.1 DUF1444 family protein [Gemella sp. GH3.1]NYS50923.1 DUF1444 family protein [Gemella sp. GH3]
MFYTEKYILDKIKKHLPKSEIKKIEKENKTFYTINFEGYKANINIENFIVRLDNNQSEKSDKLVYDFVYHIVNNLKAQSKFDNLDISKEVFLKNCYPILRAPSFEKNSSEKLVSSEHTNETKIFYSLDLGNNYRILSEKILNNFNITKEELVNNATKNLKKLPLKYNTDSVAGNTFYFLNAKDGYDGARLLDDSILKYFYKKIGSEYYIGLPHQDTLIIADIKNKKGLEILQKMMVHFFTEGLVPITTITFKYDNKNLESLFIFVE